MKVTSTHAMALQSDLSFPLSVLFSSVVPSSQQAIDVLRDEAAEDTVQPSDWLNKCG